MGCRGYAGSETPGFSAPTGSRNVATGGGRTPQAVERNPWTGSALLLSFSPRRGEGVLIVTRGPECIPPPHSGRINLCAIRSTGFGRLRRTPPVATFQRPFRGGCSKRANSGIQACSRHLRGHSACSPVTSVCRRRRRSMTEPCSIATSTPWMLDLHKHRPAALTSRKVNPPAGRSPAASGRESSATWPGGHLLESGCARRRPRTERKYVRPRDS